MLGRQSKHWMFTINNPPLPHEGPNLFTNFGRAPLYAIWQLEIGENQTPHMQGYVYFNVKIRGTTLSNYFGGHPHLEVRRGNHLQVFMIFLLFLYYSFPGYNFSQAKAYCSKDDTRLEGYWEFGDDTNIPLSAGARQDLLSLKRKIDSGVSFVDIAQDESTFGTYARCDQFLRRYKRTVSVKRHWPTEVITLVGDTGTGKTRWATETYPLLYSLPYKKGSGTYFDDYDDHDVVLIDEMYGSRFAHSYLLSLIDRYPLSVPVHHGSVNFRPHTVIFTSNAHPDSWYASLNLDGSRKFPFEDGPLKRRLTTNGSRVYRVDLGGIFTLLLGEEPVVFGPAIE